MNNNITFRILGFALIFWGVKIYFDPIQYSNKFGVTFDYTGINIYFGLIVAVFGIFFIWSSFNKNNKG